MRLVMKGLELASALTRTLILRHALRLYPLPALPQSERSRLYRLRQRDATPSRSVTPAVTERDGFHHASVTPAVTERDATPSRQRDGLRHDNVTQGFPPDPSSKHNKATTYDSFPGFCSFWQFYPKRVGKGAAYKSWKSSNCEVLSEVILKAVREQHGYLIREGGRFIPLPATWLNQRRWEDEPPKLSGVSEKTAGNIEALRRAAIRLKGGDPDATPC